MTWLSRVALVAVCACGEVAQDGSFTLAIDPPSVMLRQGESVDIGVTITRDKLSSPIAVTPMNLPAGVSAEPLQIAENATTGTLRLTASATATQGAVAVAVQGAVVGRTDRMNEAALRLLVGGAPGTLDQSFAGDGTFTPELGGLAMACRGVVMTDAGLVVTGYVVATPPQAMTARVTEDGSLDPTFGSGGFVSTGVGTLAEGIAVAEAPDGGLIVAGIAGAAASGECEYGVFRYTAAGVLDTTFAASGVAAFDPGMGCAEWHNLAITPDGTIFVGGNLFAAAATGQGARYSPTGMKAAYAISEAGVLIEGSALQPDGKLVMVGQNTSAFWIGRYLDTGAHDSGFGTNGVVTTDFPATTLETANGVVVLPDNKLLVVGTAGGNIALARYNPNGSLDVTFGSSGTTRTATPFESRSATGVVSNGTHVYFVGRRPSDKAPGVARINLDGTIDATFGTAGVAFVDFGVAGTLTNTGGFGVALDDDGRVLISGDVGPAGGQKMAIARLWP